MDDIEDAIHTADTDTGTYRGPDMRRKTYPSNRPLTDEEIEYLDKGPQLPGAAGHAISGAYVQTVKPGDPNEVAVLRSLLHRSQKSYSVDWDAARLRQELDLAAEQEVRVHGANMPEQQATDPAFEPRGEGSTASGAPAMQAHPGHGATASGGGVTSYDPGYGATNSGNLMPPPPPVEPPGGTPPAQVTTPPSNRDVPYVSGDTIVGSTLNCTMGNWEGEPTSYAYQWKRDATTDLAGSGQNSYVSVAADAGRSITCVVTATNAAGSTTAPPSNAVVVAATRAQADAQRDDGQQPPRTMQTASQPGQRQSPQPPAQQEEQLTTPPPRQPGVTEPPPRPTTPQQGIPQRQVPGTPGVPQQQPAPPVAAQQPVRRPTAPPPQLGASAPPQAPQRQQQPPAPMAQVTPHETVVMRDAGTPGPEGTTTLTRPTSPARPGPGTGQPTQPQRPAQPRRRE